MKTTKQTVEQKWTEKVKDTLVGRTITRVEYMTEIERDDSLWHNRPIAIQLDNQYWLVPMMDDEGNDGGAISTTFKEIPVIPVI